MSLSPNEKYPGRVDVDPNYQDGKFKDSDPSTANNGSPLKAIDRNEQLALQEAVMDAAGFEYSGVADTPQNSQMFKAYKAALSNGANLLSNHNFLAPSPEDITHPNATPETYAAGTQIFSGVYAGDSGCTITLIDGRVNCTAGDYQFKVANTGGLDRVPVFASSVSDYDGKPKTTGVSYALVGDEYIVTVTPAAGDVFSVKFEQGSVATGHEVGSLSKMQLWRSEGDVRGWGAVSGFDATEAFNSALSERDEIIAKVGEEYIVGDVSVIGKRITGGATIKKLASAESAFHLLGDGPQIVGMVFDAESVSGQPNTDIKLGDGAKNCRISDNTFFSPIYSAISAAVDSSQGGIPYVNKVSGVNVTNNVFRSGIGQYARPLYLHSVENITIYGNILRDCDFDAIRLRENDGYCVIDANQFINIGDPTWPDSATRDAIDVYWGGAALTITNNIVKKTAFAAFDIKGISDATLNKTRRVIITGNQIEDTRFNAIYVAGDLDYTSGDHTYIDSINISDNIIEGAGQDPGGAHGVYLENMSKYVIISNNMVLSCFGRGIFAHNSDQTKDIVRSVKILDNICVNNGRQANQSELEAGINVQAIDGLMVSGNTCENDIDMDNPYQASGIFIQSASGVFNPYKTAIISNNISRNNLIGQIVTESNGSRADNIAVFKDNIQYGPGALQRQWHDQRTVLFGVSPPAAGDGQFRQGDIVYNTNVSAGGFAGWSCVADGTPGTWKTFGSVSV